MIMKTKRGIYLNLEESEYFVIKSGLIFYFSSKQYLDKFVNEVDKYVKEQSIQINIKYKIYINVELYLLIAFYKRIEKRGFRIYDDIKKKEISENIRFANTLIKY